MDRPQVPPSKVRALARSRDGEDPGMSKSPVLARVQALPYAWLVARNSSQRVEPDVRPLNRAASAFIVERTRRLPPC